MKYIGIRGHRGAGKTTIAWLLGNAIEFIASDSDPENYKNCFNTWCAKIRENPHCVKSASLNRVIFEEFGDSPKMLISMLVGIPLSHMNDAYKKDHTIINLKNFSKFEIEDLTNFSHKLYTADEYFRTVHFEETPAFIIEDVYMTLREFILYFGIYIMQNAFGMNVWIKSMTANSEYFEGLFPDDKSGYKIYSDIKARSEIAYLKDKGGLIVKVERPGHKISGGMDLLRGNSKYDVEVIIKSNLEELADEIYNIAFQIVNDSGKIN